MINFNFMSFLLIFVLIRNAIYILDTISMLVNIEHKLNKVSVELNFRIFLLITIHILLLGVDKYKVNENKFGFIFLLYLIYSVVTRIRLNVKHDSEYLFKNSDIEENNNGVE